MNAIRIRKTISSPTINLPELARWVGKTVDIFIVDSAQTTLDDLAAAQGVEPISSINELQGHLPADAFDGFEESLREWRAEPWRREP